MAESKKRVVKDRETFRERTLKANKTKEDKNSSPSILTYPFRLIGKLFNTLANLFRQLSKVKWLRPVFRVFRFLGRIFYPKFIRESVAELRGVTWPGGKMSVRLTYAVLAFALVFGLSVALVDYGLDKLFRFILLK